MPDLNPSDSQPPEGPPRPSTLGEREQETRKPTGGVIIGNVEGGIHGSIIAGGDVTTGSSIAPERSDVQVSHPAPADRYNLAAIRKLLLAAFRPQTLRRFCQERPTFRPIVTAFGPGHGLDDMVDQVIDYCEIRLLWHEFLAEVEKDNPRQYTRFEPYLSLVEPE